MMSRTNNNNATPLSCTCGKRSVGKHSKKAILNVNIDSCSLSLAFFNSLFPLSKALWFPEISM